MFKFDFSPAAEDGSSNLASGNSGDDQNNNKLAADANELITKLIERSKKNDTSCTLVNASSQIILSTTDNDDGTGDTIMSDGVPKFKPNLRFQSHESIDLNSSNKMDVLRYVIPKHTLSDETTDLIPGVYEGGLKVWECSMDLCRFLARIVDSLSTDKNCIIATTEDDGIDLHAVQEAVRRSVEPGGTTMELGCGHALPGCFILRESIRRSPMNQNGNNKSVVIFSDFNDFVLHHATIPNAQLNVCGLLGEDGVAMDEAQTAQTLVDRSVFAGGDWMGLSYKLSSGTLSSPAAKRDKVDDRLDLIMASETTYTPESCEDTAFLMLCHLKVGSGIGLVATKRFYFGVGGGTDLFSAACGKLSKSDQGPHSDLRLVTRTIQLYDTGNANIRDLLEVRCERK